MKIGIVTIFDVTNMGNRLQNYALQKILLQYADDVVTLKNKPQYYSFKDKLIKSTFLAESVTLNLLLGKKRKAKILKFSKKYINTSKKCYIFDKDYFKSLEQCDFYCAGSDQVWNPSFRRDGLFNYLGFASSEKCFSFAASFGVEKIPEQYKAGLRKGLLHIKYISVRENSGKQIIEYLTGRKDTNVLIDPTLYFGQEEWSEIACKPTKFKGRKYILSYFLGGISKDHYKEIQRISKEHGWDIIDILDSKSDFYIIDPSEFLYLIQHAELICTDSFHASVFSFIFERPLVIFQRNGTGKDISGRLKNLALKFKFEQCLNTTGRIEEEFFFVNYAKGHEVLKNEREKVNKFLSSIFGEGKI